MFVKQKALQGLCVIIWVYIIEHYSFCLCELEYIQCKTWESSETLDL